MKCKRNTLKFAKQNAICEVVGVETQNQNIVRRLGDFGIVKGTKITVLKRSFLNKTLLVSLNGYTLSFRDAIAELIEIREVV